MSVELRVGRWQDALADVEQVDCLITDPPYSARTHDGMGIRVADGHDRAAVTYAHWSADDAIRFVYDWSPRVLGWLVVLTDDVLAPVFRAAADANGRYAFAPLPYVEMQKQPRMGGDGPASWCSWVCVSRPREKRFLSWGSLPGAYVTRPLNAQRLIKGGKPVELMRALVRDYSRPGDLICDPCAGGGTTLLAARAEGRRAIGAEMDPATHALASKRLAKPYTPQLFVDELRTKAANGNGERQGLLAMEDGKQT